MVCRGVSFDRIAYILCKCAVPWRGLRADMESYKVTVRTPMHAQPTQKENRITCKASQVYDARIRATSVLNSPCNSQLSQSARAHARSVRARAY